MRQKYLKKVTHFFDESKGVYLPVADKTTQFKKMSSVSSAVKFKKFRNTQKTELRKLRKQENERVIKQPIPGGVGYGVYYKQSFQWSFTNFSCLDFCILTPASVGGDSGNFLYLTATNGTAKGVEALISYFAQDAPVFKIFDWALPDSDRWVRSVNCTDIPENFSTININGIEHSFCRVLNKTEMIASGIWENKVYLFNFTGNNWDQVYSFQYESSLKEQKQVHNGSWGPIVETFQEVFTDLNPVGFYNSLLYNDKVSSQLTPTNSFIRDDDDGIDIAFKKSNHTFYVM